MTEVPLAAAGDPGARGEPCQTLDAELIAALRFLPPRMRAAVVLRYVEDRSEAETAELLSAPPALSRAPRIAGWFGCAALWSPRRVLP